MGEAHRVRGLRAYNIAALAGLGRETLALIAVAGAGSAVLAAVLEGVVWAAALNWLALGLDLGVLRDVARRLRREPAGTDVLFCQAGLHHLDAWEARRRWHPASVRRRRRHDHA